MGGYMIYILNTLVVPVNFDKYPSVQVLLTRISVDEAKQLLKQGFVSAVGHEGTAQLLSKILGVNIPANRVSVWMEKGDVGVHFFLKTRLPEGAVLSEEQLSKLSFWIVKSQIL
jgi:hypothetical protein